MGTWSPDILGGDGPLDVLATMDDLIGGQAKGLYPLDFNEHDTMMIRSCLEASEAKIIAGHPKYPWHDEAWPVIAAVYLATGAALPNHIRDQSLESCKKEINDLSTVNSDGWNEPAKRIAVLEKHVMDILAHKPKQITEIEHVGLFKTMSRAP